MTGLLPELDGLLLGRLDARSLGRASQVCRQWRALATPLIKVARLREVLVERIKKLTLRPEGECYIHEIAFWEDRIALTCQGAPDPWVAYRASSDSAPLRGHEGPTGCVIAWDDLLATGSYDRTARLWNVAGACVAVLRGHARAVHRLAIWDDLLATASHDDTVRLWTKKGTCVGLIRVGEPITQMMAWNAELVTVTAPTNVCLWNKDGECVNVLNGPEDFAPIIRANSANCAMIWRDLLVTGSHDGSIQLWNRAGSLVNELTRSASLTEHFKSWITWTDRGGHEDNVTCLVAWGALLVSGSADGTLRFWSENGDCLKTWRFLDGFPTCLAARDDELAVGFRNGIVHIYGVPE
jgi:WD40 repeat protein